MELKRSYPLGARLRFADNTATVALSKVHDEVVMARGIVNGEPMLASFPAHVDGEVVQRTEWFIPAWTEREGREATTVWVAESNIMEVEE